MYTTKNYSADGGDRLVIGGTLEFTEGAVVVDPSESLKGAAGADAPWLEVSHQCIIIPADATGTAIEGSVEVQVRAYIGSTQKAAAVTPTPDDDGITTTSENPEGTPLIAKVTVSWDETVAETNGAILLSIAIADGPDNPIVRVVPWVKVPTAVGA